jgi:DUF1680 family protein
LSLRIPSWCRAADVTVSSAGSSDPASTPPASGEPASGEYTRLTRRWAAGDRVQLDLPMPPRLTVADRRVDAVRGCVAIERGPLVYCLEHTDQSTATVLEDVAIVGTDLAEEWRDDLLGGVMTVRVAGAVHAQPPASLYRDAATPAEPVSAAEPIDLVAVPYALWANREVGAMRVWVPRQERANGS